MNMLRLEIHNQNPQQRILSQAVDALKRGEIVIYPTDTTYGVGCSIFNKKAIEQLYRIKGKSKFDHMSMICSSIQQAADFVKISNDAFRLLKKCSPGPYTIILDAKKNIAKLMLSRQKEIGVRIPATPVCRDLVELLGHPILNTSYDPDVADFPNNLYNSFDENNPFTLTASVLLDAGPMVDGEHSTVIRFVNDELELLREGKGAIDIF